jgi:hypothetical protein
MHLSHINFEIPGHVCNLYLGSNESNMWKYKVSFLCKFCPSHAYDKYNILWI